MAIGWLTILKSVPWTEVITNAPRVAEGARKLWKAASRKPVPPPTETGAPEPPTPEALQARLAAAEAAVSDLREQMLASSALIKDLAEQNGRLIEGIEAEQTRLRRLTYMVLILTLLAAAGLAVSFLR